MKHAVNDRLDKSTPMCRIPPSMRDSRRFGRGSGLGVPPDSHSGFAAHILKRVRAYEIRLIAGLYRPPNSSTLALAPRPRPATGDGTPRPTVSLSRLIVPGRRQAPQS